MALQGTLDTFALADVLRLLATTGKTGELLVQGNQGNGSLFLTDGEVVGGETTLAFTTVADEVLFELLRLDDGSFMFDQGVASDSPSTPIAVETVISDAESAHAEWQELSEVVPSLDVGLQLSGDLPEDTTTVDRDRWQLIVAIGSGTTVGVVGEDLGLSELPVLRVVRSLVDDGLAEIVEAAAVPDPFGDEEVDDILGSTGPAFPEGAISVGDDIDVLPTLDDDAEEGDLFDEEVGGDELPEPLLTGSVGAGPAALLPGEAAVLEAQIEDLSDEQRELVERAADAQDAVAAEKLLDGLPEEAIDRDLLRRFLGSVPS